MLQIRKKSRLSQRLYSSIIIGILIMPNVQDKQVFESFLNEGSRLYSKTTLEEFLLDKIKVRSGKQISAYRFGPGTTYLKDITRKLHNHKQIVAVKAAQVGFSTWMLGRVFWKLDGTSYNAGLYYPDNNSMKEFVQYRVDPLIENSPYLASQQSQASVSSVKLKRFGQYTIAFRSTSTMTGVKSYDADIVVLDEMDEHNPDHMEFAQDRSMQSQLDWYMAGSQPSIPHYGIHAAFEASDQRFWHIRCSGGHWTNILEFFLAEPEKALVESKDKVYLACGSCGRELNRDKGEYVAKFPDRKATGVQVSRLFAGYHTPARMLEEYKASLKSTRKRKNFYISKLGWPYASDEEQPITIDILRKHSGDHGLQNHSEYFTFLGADQGDTIHFVFLEPTSDGRFKVIGLEKCNLLEEEYHRSLVESFRVVRGNIDAMPNKSWAKRMALHYPEIIRVQYFAKNARETRETAHTGPGFGNHNDGLILSMEDSVPVVSLNRDESAQDTIDWIKNGSFIFPDPKRLSPTDLIKLEEFFHHLTMLVWERTTDENGKPARRLKKGVENHYAMALNSARDAALSQGPPDSGVGILVL